MGMHKKQTPPAKIVSDLLASTLTLNTGSSLHSAHFSVQNLIQNFTVGLMPRGGRWGGVWLTQNLITARLVTTLP